MSEEPENGLKIPRWLIGTAITGSFALMGWRIEENRRERDDQIQQTKEERALQFQLRDNEIEDLNRRVERLEETRE